MNYFAAEFQIIKLDYDKARPQMPGLVCVTGVFENCPFIKLFRESWMAGKAGIFFSVWIDNDSERSRRLHYNIHALKVRQLKAYAITSREFADAFRRKFKAVQRSWPNVRTDYGPLTLMQGWVELRQDGFHKDVLGLLRQFEQVIPLIDDLLKERDNKKR